MGQAEELVKIAAEEILQGIANEKEPEEITGKAVKTMEQIIKELEKKEEESKEFELSFKGIAGDLLTERAVIKGSSRALARAVKKLLHAVALRVSRYDTVQAAIFVNTVATEISGRLLKHAKK